MRIQCALSRILQQQAMVGLRRSPYAVVYYTFSVQRWYHHAN
jgi:hypothetical protein